MIREVLGPGGLLARHIPGYEARPGQLAMAERVAQAIDGDERLLCEAGTGTGKTLAYLVPAILSGRKVIVSTGTKTLQDQIARIDLPRLQSLLPLPFTWAVVKGLGNYLCRRRFDEHTRQASLPGGGEPPDLLRIRAWLDDTATGDRADLDGLPDDSAVWRDVASSPETRIGPRCGYFERCFATAMRRRAAEAQIVIANHHLFFADLALRSRWPDAQVLPPHEVVIFDEAHQIEEIASELFGLRVSSPRLYALARDLSRVAGLADADRAASLGSRLQACAASLADVLRARLPDPRPGSEEVRLPVPDDLWSGPALARYHELDTALEEAATWLTRLTDDPTNDGGGVPAALAPALGHLGRRAGALRDELGRLVDAGGRDHVRWLSASGRGISLHASPIDVAPALGRALDLSPGAAVFTSATLTVAGSFDYLRQRVGLGEAAAEATYPSPFRYDRQALLYLATDLPEPREEGFAAAAADRAAALCAVTGGRALLLFTSFRNLRIAEARLRATSSFPLLVQGQRPRPALLAALREHVGSVLLASQSFWEGVDVPGEALSLVVMDKIPFAAPDDPLIAARSERIRGDGGDPFTGYQLPRAALALKQGFGRLIRSRGDRGIVAVLDGRIARRWYGGTLLASLPAGCPRTESLDDVAAFWSRAA